MNILISLFRHAARSCSIQSFMGLVDSATTLCFAQNDEVWGFVQNDEVWGFVQNDKMRGFAQNDEVWGFVQNEGDSK